jgi:uncharacterized protein (UPF0332 family)
MAEGWFAIARENRIAALLLVKAAAADYYRSAISRAYYASFCRVTHELITTGATMPAGREAPSHRSVRTLLQCNMTKLEPDKRFLVSNLIGRLYTMRVDADYKASIEVSAREVREAVSIMNQVFDSF